ncbi:metal ABC transporter ATP-binding protein [Treponema parvum]|uniref:Metal ABC transporter ATP-binding protein n=1 Tax=Treponema parvum TaxID=138851 RepID=A0A975F5C2_9SPIR|nr:metal ABC transporter ATP-binding protein [Treponema parvum]QTQ14915.1 metal ABC transporter ATP-binding protein [Treponema parvum]
MVKNSKCQLICKNLTLGYDRKVVAENISFSIHQGDYLCIVGENGSGKTTLIKTLLHLMPPLGGEIIFNEGFRAGEIGYIPQQTVVQRDFPASVKEIVLSGCLNRCRFRPFYNKNEKLLAQKNMQRLGISGLENSCYRELSGGQQQRVLLARALCAAGKVLFLDEPVTGLDPKASLEMYEIVKDLNDEGITVIMISHDIAAAVKYADHILHIADYVFFGTTEEYLKSAAGKMFASL